jgi:hypothetical protein
MDLRYVEKIKAQLDQKSSKKKEHHNQMHVPLSERLIRQSASEQ